MGQSDNKQALAAARAEIDAIDDEILRLLIQREAAVEAVAEAKGLQNSDSNPLRFAREAGILRRLHRHHGNSGSRLSFQAIVRIWHELIAAYTLLQNDYAVAVSDERFIPLARSHFGDLVQIKMMERNEDRKFEMEVGNNKKLWVTPHPKDGREWLNLTADFRIIGTLPFVHSDGDDAPPQAYVVGACPDDFSSDDGSDDVLCLMVHLTVTADLDDKQLIDSLAGEDICAIVTDGNYLYCERHARLPSGEPLSLQAWQQQLQAWVAQFPQIEKITWLGCYPKPLNI